MLKTVKRKMEQEEFGECLAAPHRRGGMPPAPTTAMLAHPERVARWASVTRLVWAPPPPSAASCSSCIGASLHDAEHQPHRDRLR